MLFGDDNLSHFWQRSKYTSIGSEDLELEDLNLACIQCNIIRRIDLDCSDGTTFVKVEVEFMEWARLIQLAFNTLSDDTIYWYLSSKGARNPRCTLSSCDDFPQN